MSKTYVAPSHKSYRSINSTSRVELDNFQLINEVKEMQHQVRILRLENEILERTIMHHDPSLLHGVHHALDYAMKIRSMTATGSVISYAKSGSRPGTDTFHSASKVTASVSKYSSAKLSGNYLLSGLKINVNAKMELVVLEMKTLILEQKKAKKRIDKKHDLLIAQLEQCGVLAEETDQNSERFYKDVINGGWDCIAQRIPAEAWVRYMKEWSKAAEIQTTKLRLKTSNLNNQFRKLKNIINIKEELHESLTPVDFEKLKIENSVSSKVLDAKISQIKHLKQLVCFANINLRNHKVAMAKQQAYFSKVKEKKESVRELEHKLKKEISSIEVESANIQTELKKIGNLRQKFHEVSLIDYVKMKAEIADLKSNIKRLSSRHLILQLTSKSVPCIKNPPRFEKSEPE